MEDIKTKEGIAIRTLKWAQASLMLVGIFFSGVVFWVNYCSRPVLISPGIITYQESPLNDQKATSKASKQKDW